MLASSATVRRLVSTLLLFVLSGCSADPIAPEATPDPPAPPPRLGLWVLAEGTYRPLEHPDRIEGLVRDAQALAVSDLFVQVYRGGRSWFRSEYADDLPYRGIREQHGVDSLARMVAAAHEAGLRVHAWFNALSLALNREAPLLKRVGTQAVLVDRKGRSLLDYPGLEVPAPDRDYLRMGTRGVWLDPAVPGVIEYLERTLDDLIAAAPGLDGLHLDFIRYPVALPITPGSRFTVGLDFGYGEEARRRFGEGGFEVRRPRGDAWDDFRRDRVSEVVQRLCRRLPPEWACSAAVLPWADRAYATAMQDYRRWIEEEWLDFGVAMAYTRDDRLLRYTARGLVGGVGGDRIWVGLGTWLFIRDVPRIRRQIALARDADPPGIVLFSYDALAGEPETLDALVEGHPGPEGS